MNDKYLNCIETVELGVALRDLVHDQSQWSQATFGADSIRGPIGPLRHLVKEAAEAIEAAETESACGEMVAGMLKVEIADCLLLVLDANRRAGFTVSELVKAAAEKMVVNKGRAWPKFDPTRTEQPVEHVEDSPPARATLTKYEFTPWTDSGGMRTVVFADMAKLAREADMITAKDNRREQILVTTDIFKEWYGPMRTADGMLVNLSEITAYLFNLIDNTPNLDWMLTTAYPENIMRLIPDGYWTKRPCPEHAGKFNLECVPCNSKNSERVDKVRPNLWLGTTITDQQSADERIALLLKAPAALRYLRITPTGPIDLLRVAAFRHYDPRAEHRVDVLRGGYWEDRERLHKGFVNHSDMHGDGNERGLIRLVIVEGGAVPMNPAWVRSLRDQCVDARVPFCFRGWGEWVPESHPAWTSTVEQSDAFVAKVRDPETGDAIDYTGEYMAKVGREKAGRELDEKTWDEWPTSATTGGAAP
jgi:protein gp37